MAKEVTTDTKTMVRFWLIPLVIVAVGFILYRAATGLVIIGISIFLALALKPLVKRVNGFFNKHFGTEKKHQTSSAVLAYCLVVLVIGTIIATVGPVVVNETSKFLQQAPEMFEDTFGGWEGINNFGKSIGIENLQSEINNALSSLSSNLLGVLGNDVISSVTGIGDTVMKIGLVLVLTLLFLLEGPAMVDSIWKGISADDETRESSKVTKRVITRMANVISTYVSHQLLIAVMDGVASGLIVFLLSLFFQFSTSLAIPMGMITMTFYMIPMFGQFIGATLVTLILLFSSPVAAVIFVVIYVIWAQIENNIISPKIQGNALNLPAVMILCAVTIGMYMFGLLGAIIAIPIAGCIRVAMDEYPAIVAARKKRVEQK